MAVLAGDLALAGPFLREQVAADAKWVLHLDLDTLRASQVGEPLFTARIEKGVARIRADAKTYLDLDFDWRQISSLTAYGTDFGPRDRGQGVLLMATSMDIQRGLEWALEKQVRAGVGGDGAVARTEGAPVPIYHLRAEYFVALPAGRPLVIAKTRELLDQGLSVFSGQTATLASTSTFLDFPPLPQSFVFLAMAAGFADLAPIPPKARVLRMADAGQLVVGETGDQVFLSASLKARTSEVGAQMQQVMQGLIALGALGRPDDPELQQLLQAAKVSVQDRMVTLGMQAPTVRVIQRIQAKEGQARFR